MTRRPGAVDERAYWRDVATCAAAPVIVIVLATLWVAIT